MHVELKPGPVTIYARSELGMGVRKTEARSFGYLVGPYAQYPSAVAFHFIGKGQRKVRGTVQTSGPSLLVLEGHGHPDPDKGFIELPSSTPEVSASRSRYMSCDPRWQSDFDAMIGAYLASSGAKVVCDFREHNPHAMPRDCVAVFVSEHFTVVTHVPAHDRLRPADRLAYWFQRAWAARGREWPVAEMGPMSVTVCGDAFGSTGFEQFDFSGWVETAEAAQAQSDRPVVELVVPWRTP